MENQFIKKSTKTSCITASVISGIALISLVMILLLVQVDAGAKALIAFFFTISLVFLITFWVGILQIKVFSDYKSQRKYLCAEGIFIICLTALIIITAVLFWFLQADAIFGGTALTTIDIRWFIAVFLLGYSVWKATVVVLALKEKRFNWLLELITAVMWLAMSVLTIISIFTTGTSLNTILWIFVVVGWALVITYIVYLLLSYIFKKPAYLETPEAFEILKKETSTRNNRLARANAMVGNISAPAQEEKRAKEEQDLEAKLKKLDDLLSKNILTKEEYNEKRKQIIKDSL